MAIFSFLRKKILGVMILSVVLLLPTLSSAEEYENIGFKKDVSKELKQKFPICDEFLDVKWFGKNKNFDVGKLKTEWYAYSKKKGILHLLILSERSQFNFYKIRKQDYYSKGFENFIKESTFYRRGGRNFMFKIFVGDKVLEESDKVYDLRNFDLWHMTEIPLGYPEIDSFALFTKTVCALHPDNKTVFITETKKPFLKETLSEELKQPYDAILKFIDEQCNQRRLELMKLNKKEKISCYGGEGETKNSSALDINLDGLKDYMFHVTGASTSGDKDLGRFIYFSRNGRYEFNNIDDCIKSGPLYFKADENTFYAGKCDLIKFLEGGK